MPELPEVETIKIGLEKRIAGKTIEKIKIYFPEYIRSNNPEGFCRIVGGAKINRLSRQGKLLLIHLDNDYVLLIHLKMTGQLYIPGAEDEIDKHVHLIYQFKEGFELWHRDVRKFGYVRLLPEKQLKLDKTIKNLGPDPFNQKLSVSKFKNILNKHSSKKIKALLLDQHDIAGIGNIYADEILFIAGIKPGRLAGDLNQYEIKKLLKSIEGILNLAIESMGTTIRDFIGADGSAGNFSQKLKVYRRNGQDCYCCSTKILKSKISGRSTHYCPECQR